MTANDQSNVAPPPDRLGWVDAARGIAIVFVVFGHAWRGLDGAGLIQNADLFARVDRFVYLFHMPVFFVLSGLFLPALARQASALKAIGKQILRLLYPMALWTYLFLLARYMAGDAANTTATLRDVFVLPLPPVEHMWFLWALFCIQVPLIALLFAAPNWRSRWETPLLFFGVSILLLGIMPLPGVLFPWFYNALEYAPFVALGWLAATQRPLPGFSGLQATLALAVFMALGLLAPVVKGAPLFELGLSIVMTTAFLIIVMALHDSAESSGMARLARRLGAVSLTIFLAHTLFSAAMRSGLLALGTHNIGIHLLLGVGVGICGPYLLDHLARRLGVAKWLGF